MTNNKLQQLKEYYLDAKPETSEVDKLWQELSGRLPEKRENPKVFKVSFAFATLLLFLSLGVSLQMVSAAQPNSALYPVKLITDKVVSRVTGNYEKVIEKRTDEVIKAAKRRSPKDIEQAAKAYADSLSDVKSASPSSQSKEKVREALRESEQKLRTVTPVHPNSRPVIDETIRTTEQTIQEVKGAKTTNPGLEKAEENKSQNNGKSENSGNNQSSSESRGSNK